MRIDPSSIFLIKHDKTIKMIRKYIGFVLMLSNVNLLIATEAEIEPNIVSSSTFHIEGKIAPPDIKPKDWYWTTRIFLDGGKRFAYLKVI